METPKVVDGKYDYKLQIPVSYTNNNEPKTVDVFTFTHPNLKRMRIVKAPDAFNRITEMIMASTQQPEHIVECIEYNDLLFIMDKVLPLFFGEATSLPMP